METPDPKSRAQAQGPVSDVARASRPSSETPETVPPPSSPEPTIPHTTIPGSFAPREPFATLPDGVPSVLWEEAVESERFFAEPESKRG